MEEKVWKEAVDLSIRLQQIFRLQLPGDSVKQAS